MASILSSPSDCCSPCCSVTIVDLPTGGGGSGDCCNVYDSINDLRNETATTILVDDTSATVYGGITRGDGNGGFYFYNAASLAPDDGIANVIPNSIVRPAPGAWEKWL